MPNKFSFKKWISGKGKDILLLVGLAIVLSFVVWGVFFQGETAIESSLLTEKEKKLTALLSKIDGVGEVEVIICETEEGVQSVVVVCEGAKDILVNMHVREAVCTAVGTSGNAVKIYLKEE